MFANYPSIFVRHFFNNINFTLQLCILAKYSPYYYFPGNIIHHHEHHYSIGIYIDHSIQQHGKIDELID